MYATISHAGRETTGEALDRTFQSVLSRGMNRASLSRPAVPHRRDPGDRRTASDERFCLLVAIECTACDTRTCALPGMAPCESGSRLIAVQAAGGKPVTVAVFSFIDCCDAGERRASRFGAKGDAKAIAGAGERIGSCGDDEAVAQLSLVEEDLIERDLLPLRDRGA